MYNNKRGLSAIVATVLIILLVIAGVTLVWTPVRKLVASQSEQLEASCLLSNPSIINACDKAGNLQVTISNGAEGKIDNVQIIYGIDENTLTEVYTPDPAESIGINAVRTIIVTGKAGNGAVKIASIIGTETCLAGDVSTIGTCA